eukprot:CAMPEP_0183322728 /NCGR_PEP_ID=MMETSP0160_2-20130417/72502_1 /TAXON_ID=2839 ORGANISM="Odontella Sinensis, Strain Grunow 1884" /NCGR_SAMPLE_ID=MMETSP0160_2 /ASSEMBLY_ACC=CAM_ASM_000250 /LENGTH=434 /DNA_ID=CAMNT_0025489955 /DNA_START=44 /DNA_END=1345 /DNA_ORIENTATION=+
MAQGFEVLLTAPATIRQGETLRAYGKKCRFSLTNKGEIVVERKVQNRYKISWHSGGDKTGEYELRFGKSGTVSVKRKESTKDRVIFESHRKDPDKETQGKFELGFDKDCHLMVAHNEMYDHNNVWWAPIKLGQFEMGQHLQKGELLVRKMETGCSDNSTESKDAFLYLQPDCNLIIARGTDLANHGATVWASNTYQTCEDQDCYLYAGKQNLAIYKGSFKNEDPESQTILKIIASISVGNSNVVRLSPEGPIIGSEKSSTTTSTTVPTETAARNAIPDEGTISSTNVEDIRSFKMIRTSDWDFPLCLKARTCEPSGEGGDLECAYCDPRDDHERFYFENIDKNNFLLRLKCNPNSCVGVSRLREGTRLKVLEQCNPSKPDEKYVWALSAGKMTLANGLFVSNRGIVIKEGDTAIVRSSQDKVDYAYIQKWHKVE